MALEVPKEPRSRFDDGPAGLSIMIPARRQVFSMLFLPVWLAAWFVAWTGAASELRSGSGSWFLVVWFLGWTVGGLFAALSFMWMLVGRERVVADTGVLALSRELLGLRFKREYRVSEIRRLRVSARPTQQWSGGGAEWWGWGGGVIAFDYGAKTVRFGSVDEAEAALVVEHLGGRLHIPFTVGAQDGDSKPDESVDSIEAAEFWSKDAP